MQRDKRSTGVGNWRCKRIRAAWRLACEPRPRFHGRRMSTRSHVVTTARDQRFGVNGSDCSSQSAPDPNHIAGLHQKRADRRIAAGTRAQRRVRGESLNRGQRGIADTFADARATHEHFDFSMRHK